MDGKVGAGIVEPIGAKMVKELLTPENASFLALLVPVFLALTQKQRLAVVNRDGKKCNLPAEHDCRGQLQVHHILPQAYSGLLKLNPDFPENLITICKNAHVGNADSIHPDIAEALQNYHTDPKAIERVREQRAELMVNQEIYWNPKWDRILSATAVRNTQRAKDKGWFLPEKNGRNGGKK